MSSDRKRLLRSLKKRKPRFLNLALHWKSGTVRSWRRPRGIDNKQRLRLKSRPKQPNIGYKNPEEIRGLHPSGRKPVVVHNIEELRRIAEEKDKVVVYIAHTVGERKRSLMREEASRLGLRLAN
ncbi:MAG: eL32 family ribosomal protein [Candidatus Korarchaeum sp.]